MPCNSHFLFFTEMLTGEFGWGKIALWCIEVEESGEYLKNTNYANVCKSINMQIFF